MEFDEKLDNWRLWCRLCAKVDPINKVNIFCKDEQVVESEFYVDADLPNVVREADAADLSLAIKKHFLVNITRDEELPKILCTECFTLTTSLQSYIERVAKVQKMYEHIQKAAEIENMDMDLHAIRVQYELVDTNRVQVLMKESLPEVHFLETKPPINEVEEENCDEEGNISNPLELPRIKIKIKKENFLDDNRKEFSSIFSDDDNNNNSDNYSDYSIYDSDDDDDDKDEDFVPTKATTEKKQSSSEDEQNNVDETATEPQVKSSIKQMVKVERNNTARHFHNDIMPISCPECPRKFLRIQGFRLHMKSAHAKETSLTQFGCLQCPRTFDAQYKLKLHSKRHLPLEARKIVPCPHCNKKLTSQILLQTHIKQIHLDERSFICEGCGVALRSKAQLKSHMLIHSGVKPYKCDICEKSFREKGTLRRHKEIHDPTRPICPECGLQLSSRTTLNQHLLVHSNEMKHKCEQCGRAFKRAKTLKNHLILHTGLKPYKCDFCEQTFTFGSSCRLHKKKVHPKELAAQEASGEAKPYTYNIPKLETLKAITKSVKSARRDAVDEPTPVHDQEQAPPSLAPQKIMETI